MSEFSLSAVKLLKLQFPSHWESLPFLLQCGQVRTVSISSGVFPFLLLTVSVGVTPALW